MNSASQFLFEVVAVSPQGSLLTERLRASDASKASEQLQLRGLRVLSCREIRTSNWKGLRR
jgi:type II secretory pathway component PulF